jgi:hypothetical protein
MELDRVRCEAAGALPILWSGLGSRRARGTRARCLRRETSYRSKAIEGVSTDTGDFGGAVRFVAILVLRTESPGDSAIRMSGGLGTDWAL